MKNKALTYILLLGVGFIWYQVFFRIKGNLVDGEDAVLSPNAPIQKIQIASRDTVVLHVNYRDPFHLKKHSIQAQPDLEQQRPPVQNNRPQRAAPPQFAWPNINYYGLIRNRHSKQALALMRADGLILNLREGDEIFNDIFVRQVTPDSLVLGYKKLRRVVYR